MASSAASPCSGPSRSVTATARLSATTGLAATDPSRSYSSMILSQSVSDQLVAVEWAAAK